MADYKRMYQIMLLASEKAITQLEQGDTGSAWQLLVAAERAAEDIYIETDTEGEVKESEEN